MVFIALTSSCSLSEPLPLANLVMPLRHGKISFISLFLRVVSIFYHRRLTRHQRPTTVTATKMALMMITRLLLPKYALMFFCFLPPSNLSLFHRNAVRIRLPNRRNRPLAPSLQQQPPDPHRIPSRRRLPPVRHMVLRRLHIHPSPTTTSHSSSLI